MKKVCWFLIIVLLLGCFAGCQAAPGEGAERSIENADGTLADWMKEEIEATYARTYEAVISSWWDQEDPLDHYGKMYYYGTYDGYVMYCIEGTYDGLKKITIAGYEFVFTTGLPYIMVYKGGKTYKLRDFFEQGLIDDEAIRIAHEHYTEINKIKDNYRKQVAENE